MSEKWRWNNLNCTTQLVGWRSSLQLYALEATESNRSGDRPHGGSKDSSGAPSRSQERWRQPARMISSGQHGPASSAENAAWVGIAAADRRCTSEICGSVLLPGVARRAIGACCRARVLASPAASLRPGVIRRRAPPEPPLASPGQPPPPDDLPSPLRGRPSPQEKPKVKTRPAARCRAAPLLPRWQRKKTVYDTAVDDASVGPTRSMHVKSAARRWGNFERVQQQTIELHDLPVVRDWPRSPPLQAAFHSVKGT